MELMAINVVIFRTKIVTNMIQCSKLLFWVKNTSLTTWFIPIVFLNLTGVNLTPSETNYGQRVRSET